MAPLDWLWRVKWHAIAGATALSVVLTIWMVLRAPADDRPAWVQWIEGRSRNVMVRNHVDAKMFLYVFGGILLALNVLAAAAYHVGQFGDALNPGILLHAAMWVWFVADYFLFERVQLYTFDIIEEGVGFKLIVGCIVVYPCLYPVVLWGTAGLPAPEIDPQLTVLWLGGAAVVFLAGWVITRGANLQKYVFKRWPERAFLGFMKPATVSDGRKTLLVSGFWGMSRHSNYLGEILEALGMALAIGHFANAWTWVYFVYLTGFFIVRERIDDRRCAGKYGELWTEYRAKVRHRLVPGIY
ncbi:MAG: DUF1295 domain-containing protein [Gammaproteobacteria bacterium]|nr:DUF1295 domain-containing protein [Gammaproteobacteria bacterium]